MISYGKLATRELLLGLGTVFEWHTPLVRQQLLQLRR